MTEKQVINGKDVWIKVDAQPANRENPNVIPTQYFTASYFFQEPEEGVVGQLVADEEGETKLFESPVPALTYVSKQAEKL